MKLINPITKEELSKCCGSAAWANQLFGLFPFNTISDLKKASDRIWFSLSEIDWKEAFSHHPKIGDVGNLKEKFAGTATLAEGEQSGVKAANEQVLKALQKGNEDYEKKFGYIFIVCATGKSAAEMLALLKSRMINNPAFEIRVAAKEQNKITHLRLEKLFT
ncbi:MAG: 2-oxo-4-hydroxy-4-carboxy-5-ureidoimidazoline decarboxylase [Bacteroidetes bacterium]|nr:2-oxo-4-hydroxy-4-carboxy-5-ureidoimidazoline decarboxylase [Bacteroidota bacterium]